MKQSSISQQRTLTFGTLLSVLLGPFHELRVRCTVLLLPLLVLLTRGVRMPLHLAVEAVGELALAASEMKIKARRNRHDIC